MRRKACVWDSTNSSPAVQPAAAGAQPSAPSRASARSPAPYPARWHAARSARHGGSSRRTARTRSRSTPRSPGARSEAVSAAARSSHSRVAGISMRRVKAALLSVYRICGGRNTPHGACAASHLVQPPKRRHGGSGAAQRGHLRPGGAPRRHGQHLIAVDTNAAICAHRAETDLHVTDGPEAGCRGGGNDRMGRCSRLADRHPVHTRPVAFTRP